MITVLYCTVLQFEARTCRDGALRKLTVFLTFSCSRYCSAVLLFRTRSPTPVQSWYSAAPYLALDIRRSLEPDNDALKESAVIPTTSTKSTFVPSQTQFLHRQASLQLSPIPPIHRPASPGPNSAAMAKESLDSDRINYLIWRYVFPRDPHSWFFRYGTAFSLTAILTVPGIS